jgi:transcriptional regulator with XRE-family HTH domain
MKELGVSQNRLARNCGLSTSRINSYVSGEAIPSVHALINMAYALDLNVGNLVDFDERITK